jgi:hypothetical protein
MFDPSNNLAVAQRLDITSRQPVRELVGTDGHLFVNDGQSAQRLASLLPYQLGFAKRDHHLKSERVDSNQRRLEA